MNSHDMKINFEKAPVVILGPVGATFSSEAYEELARRFIAPPLHDSMTEIMSVETNADIIKKLISLPRGYGTIAMETRAEARVTESLRSFIELISMNVPEDYPGSRCPLQVLGAGKMKIHFALMVRQGVKREEITKVIAHPKALGACRERILREGYATIEATSNGAAAKKLAEADDSDISLRTCAALAPRAAAEKYGLVVLDEAFEDAEAVTTFFLLFKGGKLPGRITPEVEATLKPSIQKERREYQKKAISRMLIAFRVKDNPGSLVDVLELFKKEKVNLLHIDSLHTGNGAYDFAIETETVGNAVKKLHRIVRLLPAHTLRVFVFGPFEVVSM